MGVDPKEFEIARKLREKDMRARMLADSCVAMAMQELKDEVPEDVRDCRQYAHRVAQLAATLLVSGIYTNDQELKETRAELEAYREQALQYLLTKPPRMVVPDISAPVK